ncbi:biotin operon repressor [Bradyrhizobium sp. USDA 4011]
MSDDDFTGRIFAWLRQVHGDRTLHPTAFKLAFTISQFVNRKTGTAWPSLPTLAAAIGVTERAVIDLITRLEASGHLQVERHRGRSRSNTYRLIENEDDEKVQSTSPFQDEKDEVQRAKRCSPAQKKVKPTSPDSTLEPSLDGSREGEDASRRRAAGAAPPEEGGVAWVEFQQLWQRGHSDDPVKVRQAFTKAVGQHGAEAILGSARAWAAVREPQYLPNPVKWLAGGWQAAPPAGTGATAVQRTSRKRTAAEVGTAYYADAKARGR